MFTQQKRSPAFTDTDKMIFGKYKGEPLADLPASYLAWLKDTLEGDGYDKAKAEKITQGFILDKLRLYNYIFNSWEAIQMELGGKNK